MKRIAAFVFMFLDQIYAYHKNLKGSKASLQSINLE